ncbi:hypothetical protein FQN57_006958 [Myotisia sp. PD_48]|nr:hypothetical protein FQN57_006958 [Myotisia sp. PD_48]
MPYPPPLFQKHTSQPTSDSQDASKKQDMNASEADEEEDYMSMTLVEAPHKETYSQKKLRKLRESEEKSRVPSKAERAAAETARRNAALSASTLDKSSKGYQMMARLGYKPGTALGKEIPSSTDDPDKRLTVPLGLSVKEDRGGIGLDSERKRKFREEVDAKVEQVKVREEDYRDRVREEREERRQEGQFRAAQKAIERLDTQREEEEQMQEGEKNNEEENAPTKSGRGQNDDDNSKPPTRRTKPTLQINILYRGLVREREAKQLELQATRRRYESLSSRDSSVLYSGKMSNLPTYAEDELEDDDKQALGRTSDGQIVEVEPELEEDEELAQFNSLPAHARLSRALEYLRDKHHYCFWCKYQYESMAMEGCPGQTEDDHG